MPCGTTSTHFCEAGTELGRVHRDAKDGKSLFISAGAKDDPLLVVDDLHVEFRSRQGVTKAVSGLSYHVNAGETVAILGESGSGKSVSAQAVLGIVPSPPGKVTRGSIRFKETELRSLGETGMRRIRGHQISMIFQDSLAALNPVYSVGWQVAEILRLSGMRKGAAHERAVQLLDRVGIPEASARLRDYPHEFSGGMRQRVMIAAALALNPALVIADEPTTALDVTVQSQVMGLLAELQRDTGMGLVLITHDLGVVAEVADRVIVMYAGRKVEEATTEKLFDHPRHPYTVGLLQSVPGVKEPGERLTPIPGQPPDLRSTPTGCPFHPRCPHAMEVCSIELPEFKVSSSNVGSACHLTEETLEA